MTITSCSIQVRKATLEGIYSYTWSWSQTSWPTVNHRRAIGCCEVGTMWPAFMAKFYDDLTVDDWV